MSMKFDARQVRGMATTLRADGAGHLERCPDLPFEPAAVPGCTRTAIDLIKRTA